MKIFLYICVDTYMHIYKKYTFHVSALQKKLHDRYLRLKCYLFDNYVSSISNQKHRFLK